MHFSNKTGHKDFSSMEYKLELTAGQS